MNTINNIVIVGGGSAGWLTAAYLSNNLPPFVKITLIESSKIGTIGVGEGTQPYTTSFLLECGLKPKEWMPEADASYKLGVEFVGWGDMPIFVDNDVYAPHILGNELMIHDFVLNQKFSRQEYSDWCHAYKFAKANKSPKCGDPRLDINSGGYSELWDAVHFRADKIVNALKKKCSYRINHIDDEILEVQTDENGVSGLLTSKNGLLTYDLYIDCSGFKSMLLEGALKEPFISFSDKLLCNSAVAIPTEYKDKKIEMFPYTRSTAAQAGWMWKIPTFSRIGNGYVYSDKFISKEEAEQQLREHIGEWDAPANHIKMKIGTHKRIALKNVYATGLAAAFVEPLEATGITFTTRGIEKLCQAINEGKGIVDDKARKWLNDEYNAMVNEIVDFIFLHYHLSHKNDTPFWKEVHKIPLYESVKNVYDRFVPRPPNNLLHPPYYVMFHSGQWFQLLHGYGVYEGIEPPKISEEVERYGKMMWELNKYKTEKQLEIFPNHAEYLEKFMRE